MADLGLVLRSPLLEEILRIVLLGRNEWTAEELASETESPYPTVTKELRRLEHAGLVTVRVVGRTRFFTAATGDAATRAFARALAASRPQDGGDSLSKKKDKKKDSKKKK